MLNRWHGSTEILRFPTETTRLSKSSVIFVLRSSHSDDFLSGVVFFSVFFFRPAKRRVVILVERARVFVMLALPLASLLPTVFYKATGSEKLELSLVTFLSLRPDWPDWLKTLNFFFLEDEENGKR